MTGHYSLQARLLPGQGEVTGIGGNTTVANFCKQVTDLGDLGKDPATTWYMLSAVFAHERVHEKSMLPSLRDPSVLGPMEAAIDSICVPDFGQTEAQAVAEIEGTAAYAWAVINAYGAWYDAYEKLIDCDHHGATDAVEHAIVTPMINSICDHATATGWPPCPACR